MSLLEVRKQFVQVGGRYDLVVDSTAYADNGADFFIRSGQKYLDQRIEHKMSESVYYRKLQAGLIGCGFPECRAVREVWLQDSVDDSRTKLTKQSKEYIRSIYATKYNTITTGPPLDYYLPNVKVYPEDITINEIQSYFGWLDTPVAKGYETYNCVVVSPPPDHEYVLEIVGLFFSLRLVNDTDKNFWTEQYPNILLWAALRQLEITYRNTEGAKDWTAAIADELIGIDMDYVEESIADVDQMEG